MNNLSYTNRDIAALRTQLLEYAMTLTDDWSDMNESDLGVLFVELVTGVADMLNFYLDKQALECFISTVKQRKNGKGILDLIGYKFRMTNSCSCIMHCKVEESNLPRLIIPKYTKIRTNSSYNGETINYVTKYEYTIEEGTEEFDLAIMQGNLVSSRLPVADFPEDYKIYLGGSNIAEGSVMFILDGYEWTEVEDVMLDDEDGRKFSIHEDNNDVTYILLHPSYKKYLPIDNTISASIHYIESLGSNGQIPKDNLVSLEGIVNGWELSRVLSVNNEEKSSGGADRESLDLAKKRSKTNLYTMKTAVVLQDYADLAETVPGILKAKAIDWSVEDSKYINKPYFVDVYLVPENSDYCSNQQLAEVKSFLDERKTSTITVSCKNATYREIDVDITIYTTANESKWSDIKGDALSALENLFSKNREDSYTFGSVIPTSDLNSVVRNSNKYINYIDINSPNLNVVLESFEYPKLGEVKLNVVRV